MASNGRSSEDERLANAARNGDFDAFRAIVLRYSNALLAVAYGVVGDFHEAQDIVQTTFAKSYRQLPKLQNPARLGSWLYAIAHRTSLDFARARSRKPPTLSYDEGGIPGAAAGATDPILDWIERHDLREALRDALQTLEEKSRIALVLREVDDWPLKEIGRFLGLSLAATDSRIRRAREALKRRLAADYAPYLRGQRLDRAFERQVAEQVLRSMGHFYIPVRSRERTLNWFVRYFRLEISQHGRLRIESGHELYLLEGADFRPSGLPLLAFAVDDASRLWRELRDAGVDADNVREDARLGRHFAFRDPDGNRYHAVESFS